MPGFGFPRKRDYSICGKCKDPTKRRHCERAQCDWWYCSRCKVMTDRPTGRYSRFGG